MMACALVAGLAFDTASLSRKWGDFERNIAEEVNEAMVLRKLESILRIYEAADALLRVAGKAKQNKLWDLGTFTGYILYGLNSLEESRWPELEAKWANYIAETRRTPETLNVLTSTVSKARLWTVERWQSGCRAVFPDVFGEPSVTTEGDSEEDDSEEEM
jgi:hypothetical protein